MNSPIKISLLVLLANVFCAQAYSSGMAIFLNGAKEMGMANAVIAHSEGAASNYFNPALLVKTEDSIEASVTITDIDIHYKDQENGISSETDNPIFYPSAFFASYHINKDLAIGLGINSPFGLGVHWPDNWAGRYIAIDSELETALINPNISYRISKQLSVAFGIDALYASAVLKKAIPFSSFSLPDGSQKFEGDDIDISYNIAAHYNFNTLFSVGLSYRHRFELELDGKAKHNLPSPAFNSAFPNTNGSVDLNLPSQLFVGLAYKPTEKLLTEFSVRWEHWSDYKSLDFSFSQPIAGVTELSVDKDWDDTITYIVGIKYQYSDSLALTGGLLIEENPIPDHTFDPVQPTSDQKLLSIGVQKQMEQLNFALSYAYIFHDDRTKENSIGSNTGYTANGKYSRDTQMLSFSLSYLL